MFVLITKNKWLNSFALIIIALTCIAFQKIFIPKFDLVAGNLISGNSTNYIREGNVLSQPFISNKNGMSTIQVFFIKQDSLYPDDAVIDWKVLSIMDNTPVAQGEILVNSIRDKTFYVINFIPIKNSYLKPYVLKLSSSMEIDGIAIASSSIFQSDSLAYQINNKVQQGTIVFYTGYASPDFNLLIIFRGLIFAIPLWIVFLFREEMLVSLEKRPLHYTVTTVVVLVGLFMVIFQPPLHMFDEPEHFRRVWEVSTGKLIPSSTDGIFSTRLPVYIQQTYNRIYRSVGDTTQNPVQIYQMLLEPAGDETLLSSNGLISTYSFFAYLVPAFFVRLGIWLGISALGLTYLARVANLIQFAFLTYWSLKQASIGGQTIAAMALMSLVLTQGMAINIDSLMIGGTFLFMTSAFNLIWPKDESLIITGKEIAPIVFGAICILVSKHIYLPIISLIILIPSSKFGTLKNKWKWIFLSLLTVGVLSVFLQILVMPGNDPRIDTSSINPAEQLKFILNSPLSWLRVFSLTMINNGFDYYNQFNLLNGTNKSIGIFAIFQFTGVLFFSWSEKNVLQNKITIWHQIYSFFIIFITSMFIALPLYLYWTPVGASGVNGLQGRYFLPVIILALVVFRPKLTYNGKYIRAKLLIIMTSLLLIQMWMIYQYFY
jgi:uncharacterized membrane protein